MVNFIVIRHGKTELNKKGIILGHATEPISDSSIEDIRNLGNKINRCMPEKIYSSDLKRASQTAKLLKKHLQIRNKNTYSRLLREVNYGQLTGMKKKDARQKFPEYHNQQSFVHPEGESFLDMQKRIIRFLDNLSEKDGTFLIVTHAGVMRGIYSYCRGEEIQKNINMKITHNCILICKIDKKNKKVNFLQR